MQPRLFYSYHNHFLVLLLPICSSVVSMGLSPGGNTLEGQWNELSSSLLQLVWGQQKVFILSLLRAGFSHSLSCTCNLKILTMRSHAFHNWRHSLVSIHNNLLTKYLGECLYLSMSKHSTSSYYGSITLPWWWTLILASGIQGAQKCTVQYHLLPNTHLSLRQGFSTISSSSRDWPDSVIETLPYALKAQPVSCALFRLIIGTTYVSLPWIWGLVGFSCWKHREDRSFWCNACTLLWILAHGRFWIWNTFHWVCVLEHLVSSHCFCLGRLWNFWNMRSQWQK